MKPILILAVALLLCNCNGNAQKKESQKTAYKVVKTDAEWKAQLSPEAYNVLRKAGTERPFSSPLYENHKKGTYVCAGCNTPLFKSEHKFNSGTGWPSFDQEIKGNVAYGSDYDLGYERDEEHCAVCGGHLGHRFNDGPKNTTGLRHCINGVALKFIPEV